MHTFHSPASGHGHPTLSSGVLTRVLTVAQLLYVSFGVTKGKAWLSVPGPTSASYGSGFRC